MVVDALKRCALHHSVCDFKGAQMNVRCSLISDFMSYKFELGHKEATKKTFFYAEGGCAVDHSTVTRGIKKFRSCCKNLDGHLSSGLKA